MKSKWMAFLRIFAILMLGITVALTLLGAVGSTCAAFAPEKFASMLALAPFQWMYQSFVVISLAAGVAGIHALVGLVRGAPRSYRETLIVLLVAGGAALAQVVASRLLRGKSMPTDVRLYVNALTLVVFLLLRIPKIWAGVGLVRNDPRQAAVAGGIAAILAGALALTVDLWAASTHTFGGVNFAAAFRQPVLLVGWVLVAGGLWLLLPRPVTKTLHIPALRYGKKPAFTEDV